MIDRVLKQSSDREFYCWLLDNHVGVGPQMAACIVSELSSPARFHSVSAMWAYCGLHVINGRAARRKAGEKSNWNSFLKAKLIGVLADIIIKHQTGYLGSDYMPNVLNYDKKMADFKAGKKPNPPKDLLEYDEKKSHNIQCLVDYKTRLLTIDENVPEADRYYDAKGKEIFHHHDKIVKGKPSLIEGYDKNKKLKGQVYASTLKRRTKAHIQDMSKRYMIKTFLLEAFNEWRKIEGLPPMLTYDEAKLRGGVKHLENAPPRASV